jgi:hypothetical protein
MTAPNTIKAVLFSSAIPSSGALNTKAGTALAFHLILPILKRPFVPSRYTPYAVQDVLMCAGATNWNKSDFF